MLEMGAIYIGPCLRYLLLEPSQLAYRPYGKDHVICFTKLPSHSLTGHGKGERGISQQRLTAMPEKVSAMKFLPQVDEQTFKVFTKRLHQQLQAEHGITLSLNQIRETAIRAAGCRSLHDARQEWKSINHQPIKLSLPDDKAEFVSRLFLASSDQIHLIEALERKRQETLAVYWALREQIPDCPARSRLLEIIGSQSESLLEEINQFMSISQKKISFETPWGLRERMRELSRNFGRPTTQPHAHLQQLRKKSRELGRPVTKGQVSIDNLLAMRGRRRRPENG